MPLTLSSQLAMYNLVFMRSSVLHCAKQSLSVKEQVQFGNRYINHSEDRFHLGSNLCSTCTLSVFSIMFHLHRSECCFQRFLFALMAVAAVLRF